MRCKAEVLWPMSKAPAPSMLEDAPVSEALLVVMEMAKPILLRAVMNEPLDAQRAPLRMVIVLDVCLDEHELIATQERAGR